MGKKLHLLLALATVFAMGASAYSLDANDKPNNQTKQDNTASQPAQISPAQTSSVVVAQSQPVDRLSLDDRELLPFRAAHAAAGCLNANELCGDGKESCCPGLFCKKSASGDKICLKP